MSTKQYNDSEGTLGPWQQSARPCRYCGALGQHFWRLWESTDGAFEDEKHECRACDRTWWVDGPDS